MFTSEINRINDRIYITRARMKIRMPTVPDAGDVKNSATDSAVDGALLGVATGVGRGAMGGIGHAAGGVLAGASIGGQKGETLASQAVAEGLRSSMFAAGGGGSARGVK